MNHYQPPANSASDHRAAYEKQRATRIAVVTGLVLGLLGVAVWLLLSLSLA